jgi:hypothetical protein
MAEPLVWALASLGFAMSIFVLAMSYRVLFARKVTGTVNFRVTALGDAAAKISID